MRPCVVDVQVARVQVAVEQPVPQAALEQREHQRLDQFDAVEPRLSDGCGVVDPDAMHPLHRQHPLAGELPVHVGHPNVLAQRRRVQVGDPGVHRLCLEAEVQLPGQVVGEVGDDVLRREPAPQLGQFDGLRETLQDLQVGGDPSADARPLDLDDDFLAGVQGRIVHLGDGCRREWLLVPFGEQLRRVTAEFLDDELVHLAGVGGWHPVKQPAEFAGQRLTECAGAGRHDLSELHVGRPEIGKGLRQLLDDFLLPRTLGGQLGDDARGGAGDLPTGAGYPDRFDRQGHPVELGYLAVFGSAH